MITPAVLTIAGFLAPASTLSIELLDDESSAHPDGLEVRAEFLSLEDGTKVRHGDFRVIQSTTGETVVKGKYENGEREGRWIYSYRSGDKAAVGTFKKGQRSGKWKFYWLSGEVAAEGSFRGDLPSKKWEFFGLDGKREPGPAITIVPVGGTSSLDGSTYSGYLGNGAPIGSWKIVRTDGSLVFQGAIDSKGRLQEAKFEHAGGVADPEWFAIRESIANPLDRAFQLIDEYGRLQYAGSFPAPPAEPGLDSGIAFLKNLGLYKEAEVIHAVDPKAKRQQSIRLQPGARAPGYRHIAGLEARRDEIASAIKLASSLDWSDKSVYAAGVSLLGIVLEPLLGYPDLGIESMSSKHDPDAARLAVLRADSMLWFKIHDDSYREIDASIGTIAPRSGTDEGVIANFDPAVWLNESDREARAEELAKAARTQGTLLKRKHGAYAKVAGPALDWLLAEQREDGSWMAGSSRVESKNGIEVYDEGREHDVGVTALAVIALVRDPLTPGNEVRLRAIRRACAYILGQRSPGYGFISNLFTSRSQQGKAGQVYSGNWIYDHTACLQALAEASHLVPSRRLRIGIEDAARVLMEAKNPYGCWRYSLPANGDSDTSVTYWAMRALLAAEETGVPLDDSATTHVLQFLDEMTDEGTGRVGYTERGSPSSREPGVNQERFPTDSGETLTAMGLHLRFLLGQTVEERGIMKDHANLIMRRLPKWEPEKFGCDMSYWMPATAAMTRFGGKHREEWLKALYPSLLDSQVKGGEGDGSWPPVGPWGAYGGRVYSTCYNLMALQYAYGVK